MLSAGPGVLHDPGFLVPFALVQTAIVLTIVRSLDPFERRPLGLLVLMLLGGATVAPLVALTIDEHLSRHLVGAGRPVRLAVFSAVVEEPSKSLAVLVLFAGCLIVAPRTGQFLFEGVNDGIVYGAAAGLGFTFTENLLYLTRQDSLTRGLTVFAQRSDFFGTAAFAHAIYTAWFGAGLGMATWTRRRSDRLAFPVIGLGIGIGMHALHNGLLAEGYVNDVRLLDFAYLAVTLGAIAAWAVYQQRIIYLELAAERAAGLPVTDAQIALAASPLTYVVTLVRAFRAEEADAVPRVRELRTQLIELALARWRQMNTGSSAIESAGHRMEVLSLVR